MSNGKIVKFQIGDKHGKWTIINEEIEQHINQINNVTYYRHKYTCKCICGREKTEYGSKILYGGKSCPNCKINWDGIEENLLNKKFNSFTVIKLVVNRILPNGLRRVEWKCQCECGEYKNIRETRLKSGKFISCNGCHSKESISSQFFCRMRNGAKQRNIEFNITAKEMYEILENQDFKCVFTGEQLFVSEKSIGNASLDRKNSNIGYTKDNCQWIHKNINIIKNSFSNEQFLSMCKQVYEYKIRENNEDTDRDWKLWNPMDNKELGKSREEENIWNK